MTDHRPLCVDDIWAKAGKRREDYVEFVKWSPFYQILGVSEGTGLSTTTTTRCSS